MDLSQVKMPNNSFNIMTYLTDSLSFWRKGFLEKSYPSPRSGVAAGRSYPMPEARGGGREDQPHVQGAVAARVQKGLEVLSHVEGQEVRRWGDTPHPR